MVRYLCCWKGFFLPECGVVCFYEWIWSWRMYRCTLNTQLCVTRTNNHTNLKQQHVICIQLVELTTWAQFTGHQTDFHCMLINNGALLICSRSKRRRKMPHASLTYFYWHARLHGRHGKVFSDKTGSLPLFAFLPLFAPLIKPLSSDSLSYISMQVRRVVDVDIVTGRDAELLHVSTRIFMLTNICHFHASNITCMLRWCLDFMCGTAHIMERFIFRCSFWHLSMSQEFTYKRHL